jgi:hypothetical protein
MADYYPLISRAVTGLDKNTGENRRVLYERARAALINQLRGVEPALEEADITRERLALEEAIRKVEADTAAQAKPEPPQPHEPPEEEAPEPTPTSLRDQGLRDFHQSMAEVDELGEAASHANRSARESFEALPGDRPPPPADRGAPADGASTHYFEPPGEPPPPHALDRAPDARDGGKAPFGEHAEAVPEMPPLEEAADAGAYPPVRSHGRLIKIVLLILVLAGLAGAGYWQRDAVTSMVASLRTSKPAVKPAETPRPAAKPKIADRVKPTTAPDAAKPANAPGAAVAQKVVLYEEQPNNPQGKRYVGSAIWRTETVSPGPGLAPELAVRADVEIPERHMRMTWSLRRNTDKALPASHTIEIMFTLPADFDQGSIGNVPGVLMKTSEEARGVPLAGLAVKVTNGYFLIGLSAVDIDVQRNIALLKDRDWFDIPLVYTSGKRAILAVEKGPPGARAFAEAFRAWGE